jgi:hypothetical protein|tara:strand:- start:1252 stop:1434 length:183 start_codon:yes stop_codon:yes gene_type:complete
MYDIDTILAVKLILEKRIIELKEHIVYSIDNVEALAYAKGKLNGMELLLQDLKDLQKGEE